LDEAKGDIIVFADDDSIPKDTWLEQIEKHFLMDDKIGGVGGRDFVYIDNQSIKGKKRNVGTITWYGRVIGNHHLGFNSPREVDHLKGANMGFRREAIGELRFDEHLRGSGAQYRNDLALCLAVKQKGWKLIYDPQVAADHYYSKRFDEDQRGIFNPDATRDLAHNEIYVFLKYMHGIRRPVCILFTLLVGSTAAPGMAQFLRLLLRGHKKVWSRFLASIQGQCEGYKTWRTSLVKKKHFKYGKG
jgi:GT2 family glycosyltransferase